MNFGACGDQLILLSWVSSAVETMSGTRSMVTKLESNPNPFSSDKLNFRKMK